MAYQVPPEVQVVDTQLQQPLTEAQMRSSPMEVTGELSVEFPTSMDVDTGLEQGLTDAQLRANPVEVTDENSAKELTQLRRLGGGKTAVVATVVASGDTSIHTPASGKRIQLFWVSAINNPTAESAPVIKISIGTTEYYRVYAVAHWEIFTGAPDEELIINLSTAGTVQVTAHILEID